ncbi:UdgX family uracil-DNA binding protein [Pseudacidovorax intermedius]|uniref:Type-4 uracil-DNA glycosylase n=1 Tax=Pseudacidovorax intermedius TaxID=433924 RepID=A0A147GRA9_9BURK|nr:UdgX family uracil-DNA binding protein [Pseudacidovorax intermedius]KTT18765.1 DNA polymerase [Pseudacidovorax intermedius]
MSPRVITLESEIDWPGFRREARALLAALVPPDEVQWQTPGQPAPELWADQEVARPSAPPAMPTRPLGSAGPARLVVPPAFLTLCEKVVLHQDPQRFALLYRLLWRLVHERGLRQDPLDPDRLRARQMLQSVRRDMHKMKAFVRFRPVGQPEGEAPLSVAWFEPEHHIVEAVAPFFVRRFTQMHWAILTPECSVRWMPAPPGAPPLAGDDALPGELEFGPGASREQAPGPDEGEVLWLTYYAHIFNPARLKLSMMAREMPRKYWSNLPEAKLIAPLAAQAAERTGRMVQAEPAPTRRRLPARPPLPPAVSPGQDPAHTLEELARATDRCRDCPIGEHATQSVFGEGPLHPALMLVGEQPGDQEDLAGHPFVGPAGQLLDRALEALGWSRDALYLTNAVKHFKFELRGTRRIHKSPGQREVLACQQWLEREIAVVRPRAFVALGATAARALVGRAVPVMTERGQWLAGPEGVPVLVTLHPSALLRGDPAERESQWQAWLTDLALASRYLSGEDAEELSRPRAAA